MSQFYNRYVPPDKHVSQRQNLSTQQTRENLAIGKRKRSNENAVNSVEEPSKAESSKSSDKNKIISNPNGDHNDKSAPEGTSVLAKYSISQFAKQQDNKNDITLRKKQQSKKRDEETQIHKRNGAIPAAEVSNPPRETQAKDEHKDNVERHSRVLSKYDKSRKRSQNLTDLNGSKETEDDTSQEVQSESQVHGLVPIPQPENPVIETKPLTYSTLPSWQAAATKVGDSTVEFTELGLGDKILSNLKSQGIRKAFPVQSAVIPMLVQGDKSHSGDVCVSAATGSGKTLAYVIPIIEHLLKHEGSGLRAIIVVPTRELVKQVRETCEVCAVGSSLVISTALGSKTLAEEQKSLVEKHEVYDPKAYTKELNTPLDWTKFSLEQTLQRARRTDPMNIVNYVTRYKIKADVLITTPGRLVDHLQNTEGFNLDHVQWLVVDEADRLLNESYQEWIDVVVPALQSRRATEARDRILEHMRLELPQRSVTKVLLSATMTKDISKLNHIGLNNPKLVVLDSPKQPSQHSAAIESGADADEPVLDNLGNYALPASLQEFAVSSTKGQEKPLLILQVLMQNGALSHQKASSSVRSATKLPHEPEISDPDSDTSSDSEDSRSSSSSDASVSSVSSSSCKSPRRANSNDFRISQRPPHAQDVTRMLVFARSTSSAARLSRLLSLLSPKLAPSIVTLTRSTASSASSRKALSSFRSGKTPILIATDRASRGIDVPGLQHVINYDIPGSALAYLHRVGRTARAGEKGNAWTIVEHHEGKWFWGEIGGKGDQSIIRRSGKVKKIHLTIDERLQMDYENALQILGSEVKGG